MFLINLQINFLKCSKKDWHYHDDVIMKISEIFNKYLWSSLEDIDSAGTGLALLNFTGKNQKTYWQKNVT